MRLFDYFIANALLPLALSAPFETQSDAVACHEKPRWFSQAIDHFDSHNGTFQQKFYIDTTHYKPGGPILLFEGEESTVLDCVDSTIMYDFAKELNGIVINLEHRYFGESVPFGPDLTSYSHSQWKFLTLDNVMQDAVTVVNSVRANVTGADSAPVFAASGSYGGFLMTMFRQNHPETFRGVIASAPVVRGFFGGNQKDVPQQYNWWNYVSNVYREQSAHAAANIQNAFDTLVGRFASNDFASLQNDLNLCYPIADNSTTTVYSLLSLLQQVFVSGAEFNYAVAHTGRSSLATPLTKFVDIAIEEKDPLQILNRTNYIYYSTSAKSANLTYGCFNQSDYDQVRLLTAPLISTVPFDYIACTYLQFATSSVGNGTIFPASITPPSVENAARGPACLAKYGVEAPSGTEFYKRYHTTDAELRNSTGIMLSVGEYDPTTALAGRELIGLPVRADVYASRQIYTSGMAHREDLFAQDHDTREAVRRTNKIELETIKEWMALDARE